MDQKALDLCQIADMAFLSRNYPNSMENYNKALAIDSDCLNALIGKGLIFYELKEYEESLSCFENALTVDRSSVRAMNGKGASLIKLSRHKDALDVYEHAIEMDNKFIRAYIGRGVALAGLGKYEEALNVLEQSILINQNFLKSHLHKGWILQSLSRFEESVKAFDKVVEIDNSHVGAYVEKGKSLIQLKLYIRAEEAFQQALQMDGSCMEAYLGLGMTDIAQSSHGTTDSVDTICTNLFKAYSLRHQSIYPDGPFPFDVYLSFFSERYYAPLFIERLIEDRLNSISDSDKWADTLSQNNKFVSELLSYFNSVHQYFEEKGSVDSYHLHYGILQYLLGEPFQAYKCFDEIVDTNLPTDLQGQYYFNLSAIKIQHAERAVILRNTIDWITENIPDENSPVQNYYAGRIFLLGGQEENALRCFSMDCDNFAPSYFMKCYLLRGHQVELQLYSNEINLNDLYQGFMKGFTNCSSDAIWNKHCKMFEFIIYSELFLAIGTVINSFLPGPLSSPDSLDNNVLTEKFVRNMHYLQQWKAAHDGLDRKEVILGLL